MGAVPKLGRLLGLFISCFRFLGLRGFTKIFQDLKGQPWLTVFGLEFAAVGSEGTSWGNFCLECRVYGLGCAAVWFEVSYSETSAFDSSLNRLVKPL